MSIHYQRVDDHALNQIISERKSQRTKPYLGDLALAFSLVDADSEIRWCLSCSAGEYTFVITYIYPPGTADRYHLVHYGTRFIANYPQPHRAIALAWLDYQDWREHNV